MAACMKLIINGCNQKQNVIQTAEISFIFTEFS